MNKGNFRNAMITIYKKALAKPTRAKKIVALVVFIEFLTFELRQRRRGWKNEYERLQTYCN